MHPPRHKKRGKGSHLGNLSASRFASSFPPCPNDAFALLLGFLFCHFQKSLREKIKFISRLTRDKWNKIFKKLNSLILFPCLLLWLSVIVVPTSYAGICWASPFFLPLLLLTLHLKELFPFSFLHLLLCRRRYDDGPLLMKLNDPQSKKRGITHVLPNYHKKERKNGFEANHGWRTKTKTNGGGRKMLLDAKEIGMIFYSCEFSLP